MWALVGVECKIHTWKKVLPTLFLSNCTAPVGPVKSTATIFTKNVNSGSYSPNPLNHIKESYKCKENLEKWGKNIWYASQFCLSSLYIVQAIGAILIFSVSYTRKKWNSGSYKYPSTWTINLHDLKLGSLYLYLSIRYLQESL